MITMPRFVPSYVDKYAYRHDTCKLTCFTFLHLCERLQHVVVMFVLLKQSKYQKMKTTRKG